MNARELVDAHRDEILHVTADHGARSVRLFGSLVRDEAGPDSDVDFLVELEPGRTLFDQAALKLDLERILGRKVDVVTEGGLRPSLRERILHEAVPL
jgi:predicted nucleotidyltransferase